MVIGTLSEEWFTGDQMRTNQILTNLLSNAIKFTPEGGSVTLLISQLEDHGEKRHLRFVVSDTGIGMTEGYLSHIWDPFEEADFSSRRFGGTGLGLSITKFQSPLTWPCCLKSWITFAGLDRARGWELWGAGGRYHTERRKEGGDAMNSEQRYTLSLRNTDIDGALGRLCGNEALYEECLRGFLQDPTVSELNEAVKNDLWDSAFTAAHALKGVAGNMGFIPLMHSVGQLLILIRGGRMADIPEALEQVNSAYRDIIDGIEFYFDLIDEKRKEEGRYES